MHRWLQPAFRQRAGCQAGNLLAASERFTALFGSRLQTTNDISHGVPNLPDQPYDTLEALLNALNAWGRQRGVGFTKMRPSNHVNGSPTRYEIACDRGGREKTSKAMLRRTTTSKTGCPWFGVTKALAESDRKYIVD